jgi:hypothetical protein
VVRDFGASGIGKASTDMGHASSIQNQGNTKMTMPLKIRNMGYGTVLH